MADFQATPATGTATDPDHINDNKLATIIYMDAIGEYCEITFDDYYYVKEFRYFGASGHNFDGTYKIQHWDGSSWVDNTTGIPTRTNTWSGWTALTKAVRTNKVRWVATALDTRYTRNSPAELEMRG